jgi:DNA mismatch repair protein MutS2
MSNIVRILSSISNRALVLLDELGAGTDPTEGAALAVAILQHLRKLNVRCAVTTHYSELKLFALSTEGVENASCEFNVETLRPTYRLLIGIPGKSNAFAIAGRLGLPEQIISQAKDVLSHEDIRFEDMITDLEISKKSVLIEQERAEQYRREAEVMRADFEKQKDKLTAQRDKFLKEARDEAASVVRKARDEADALFREFRKKMEDNLNQRDLDDARRQIKDKLSGMEGDLLPTGEIRVRNAAPPELHRGDRVHIHSLNQSGTVSALPDTEGMVLIQAGIMKIKIHISDLSIDDTEEKEKRKLYAASRSVRAGKSQSITHEVDLRGMMTEEAAETAEKYVDDAYLAGMESVRIIHGKGTGALRKTVHAMLKRSGHVAEYRLGKYGEGEDGVTVVTLKK